MLSYVQFVRVASSEIDTESGIGFPLLFMLVPANNVIRALCERQIWRNHWSHVDPSRAVLLAGADFLWGLGWLQLWIIFAFAIARHPSFRLWVLSGAVLGAVAATVPGLFTGVPMSHIAPVALICAHLSALIAYAASKMPWARLRRYPERASAPHPDHAESSSCASSEEHDHLAPPTPSRGADDLKEPNDVESLREEHAPTAAILQKLIPFMLLTNVWLISSINAHVGELLYQTLTKSALARDNMIVVECYFYIVLPALIVVVLFCASMLLSPNRVRECVCGLLVGGGFLTVTRATSAFPAAWEAWLVDGLLAMLAGSLGIMLGWALGE